MVCSSQNALLCLPHFTILHLNIGKTVAIFKILYKKNLAFAYIKYEGTFTESDCTPLKRSPNVTHQIDFSKYNIKYVRLSTKYQTVPIVKFMKLTNFEKIHGLKGINLDDNALSDMSFLKNGVYPGLTHLSLDRNDQILLKDSLAEVANSMEKLSIKDCNISTEHLEQAMADMPALRLLNLRGNSLTTFGNMSFFLPSLKVLDLSHNSISSLSRNIFRHLQSLTVLRLDGNHICSLDFLPTLISLNVLSMSRNDLCELGDALYNCRNLCILELSDNKIRSVNRELSLNLPCLKYIDVARNENVVVDNELFCHNALTIKM